MKNIIYFFTICIFFSLATQLKAQQVVQPYTAKAYWLEESNETFKSLIEKDRKGEILSTAEQEWLITYRDYLTKYYDKLSDDEKKKFELNKTIWDKENQRKAPKKLWLSESDETPDESSDSNTELYHLLYSGYFGMYYGLGTIALLEPQYNWAVGIPFLTAGGSMLMPILLRKQYGETNNNSMMLSLHGRYMGAVSGFALALLLQGEDFANDVPKLAIGLGMIGSITGGHIGYKLGITKNWTEGRVGLYRYYSKLFGAVAIASLVSTESESARLYSLTAMTGVGLGYVAANQIAKRTNYTRGDIVTIEGLTMLTTGLGFAVMADVDEGTRGILIPTIAALAATGVGHTIVKDTRFTLRQGRRTEYAMLGGALIGLGIAAITESSEVWPYYTFPYVTGIVSYGLMINHYKQKNLQTSFHHEKSGLNFSFKLHPENYFINEKLGLRTSSNRPYGMQLPLASFSAVF